MNEHGILNEAGGSDLPNDSRATSKFEDLVFQQELNEVFLLIDFISGRPDKHLSELDGRIDNPEKPGTKMTATEVVAHVSKLRYPPSAPPENRAQDAAFLMSVKDILNSAAYPARGLTIAYTVMFAESSMFAENSIVRQLFKRSGKGANRRQAAEAAFPALGVSAARFRVAKNILAAFGLLATVGSAILLWQVTYGVQLAGRFEEAKKADSQAEATIYDELEKEQLTNDVQLSNPVAICDTNSAPSGRSYIPQVTSADAVAQTVNHPWKGSLLRQACNEFAYRHALFCVAIADVGQYSRSSLFLFYDAVLPIHLFRPGDPCDIADSRTDSEAPAPRQGSVTSRAELVGRQEDAQSVAGVLAMMANYMLPILFGLVGTVAALVRSIQDKVTDSVLAPRDKALMFIRLPLGMIAGVCVGLFFNPTAVAAQSGGTLGALTISASGIAFLAGYGAEGFFRLLDTLIARVFSLDGGGKASPAMRR